MNIKNITTLKRAAKDAGITLPGKPVASCVFPVSDTNGYAIFENKDGHFGVAFYSRVVTPNGSRHPLNKRRNGSAWTPGPLHVRKNIAWQDAPINVVTTQVLDMVALY